MVRSETTKRFNQQVNRNRERFPEDCMFQLNDEEYESLRLQFATLKIRRGQHRKYLPHVFTGHGAIMAAPSPPRSWACSASACSRNSCYFGLKGRPMSRIDLEVQSIRQGEIPTFKPIELAG